MKKILFKLFIFIIISFGFLGCARKVATVIYSPKLNDVSTVETGNNMFTKTYAYFKHKRYVKLIDEEDRRKYHTKEIGNIFDKLEGAECALYNFSNSLLDYNCDGYFTHLRNRNKLEKPVKYKIIAPPYTSGRLVEKSFMRDVIYQGKTGNKLKISFREFIRSKEGKFIIRDAFTQTIQYELDQNGEAVIGFKGLRIKVLKATNFDITYKVLKDYN